MSASASTTATPGALASRLAAAVPDELRERAAWVLWRGEVRDARRTKVPYTAEDPRRRANTTDPRTWTTFERAVAAVGAADGLGYVFSSDDGFCGVDLDRCLGEDGAPELWAEEIVSALDSYTERSVSGRGLRGPGVP